MRDNKRPPKLHFLETSFALYFIVLYHKSLKSQCNTLPLIRKLMLSINKKSALISFMGARFNN